MSAPCPTAASWLTPTEGGGWCRFEENDVHLRFLQSEIPLWTSGANFFGTWGSQWAQGSLNLDCQGPVDIDATGQSWAWPSSWPQVQSGLWATSVDGMECPVNVVDLAPVPEQECRLGDEKKGSDWRSVGDAEVSRIRCP